MGTDSPRGLVDGEAGWCVGIKKEGFHPLATDTCSAIHFYYLIELRPQGVVQRDLLRKGSFIDTGVDSGLGESCGLFDLREAEEFAP